MKYRYEYLSDKFDNSKSFIDVKVECLHRDVDVEKLSFSYQDEEEIKQKQRRIEENRNENLSKKDRNVHDNHNLSDEQKENIINYLYTVSTISKKEEDVVFNANTTYDIYSSLNEELASLVEDFLS